MTTLIISIGRNLGYNVAGNPKLSDLNWDAFQFQVERAAWNQGFEVLVTTRGNSTYVVDGRVQSEDSKTIVCELPNDQEAGPLLSELSKLAKKFGQKEIAVTYGVYKPVAAK